MVQDFARYAARIITSCKKRDISRARAKQVLHARFLHNLASSFLLGSSKIIAGSSTILGTISGLALYSGVGTENNNV